MRISFPFANVSKGKCGPQADYTHTLRSRALISNIIFSYKEVVTALLKEQNIHEGLWSLFIRFGLNAANMGPNDDELKPCAVIPIVEIGIQKGEKDNSITVDAAKVNPRPPQLIPDPTGRKQ